eukprot:281222_1
METPVAPQAAQLKNAIHELRQVLSAQQYTSTSKLFELENMVSSMNIAQIQENKEVDAIEITHKSDEESKRQNDYFKTQIQCKELENQEIRNKYNALQCQYDTLNQQHDMYCKINDMRLNRFATMYKIHTRDLKNANEP